MATACFGASKHADSWTLDADGRLTCCTDPPRLQRRMQSVLQSAPAGALDALLGLQRPRGGPGCFTRDHVAQKAHGEKDFFSFEICEEFDVYFSGFLNP